MKKFKFKIRGNDYNVEILSLEDNIAEVEVNGSTYQVEIDKTIKGTKTPKLVRPKIIPTGGSDRTKTNKPSETKGVGYIKAPLPGTILELKVKMGDEVEQGTVICEIGDTALFEVAQPPHLHFEVISNGISVNPLDYLP